MKGEFFSAEFLLQRMDKLPSLFGTDVTSGKVIHIDFAVTVTKSHQVQTKCDIIRSELDPHTGGFQR